MNWETLNNRAYVPYSKRSKSCIVQGSKGGLFVGVRVENVSFPITISAIQAACCISLSEGERPVAIYLGDKAYDQLDFWKKEFNLEVKPVTDEVFKAISIQLKQNPANELVRLKELLDQAITIHSNFPVSAILNTPNGTYEGVNVEVSDWALGLCAERVVIAKALAAGESIFTDLAVHTRYGEVSSPCGACRQVIVEHLRLLKIRMYHSNDTLSEHFSNDMLPFSFTSKTLQN